MQNKNQHIILLVDFCSPMTRAERRAKKRYLDKHKDKAESLDILVKHTYTWFIRAMLICFISVVPIAIASSADQEKTTQVVTHYDQNYFTEASTSQIGNEFMYTGQRWDSTIGKYNYKSRYYDPSTARFMQPDPMGYIDSHSPYHYVANDPINHIDPTGQVLNNLIGAGTSISTNALLANALGQEYTTTDAIIDGSLGFVTSGLSNVAQLKNLKKISDFQRSALNMGVNATHVGLDVAADYAHYQSVPKTQTSKSDDDDESFDLTESVFYSLLGISSSGTPRIDNYLGGFWDLFGGKKQTYKDAPYHHVNSVGKKSPPPEDGLKSLKNSIQIKPSSPRRISVDSNGNISRLDKDGKNSWHGHTIKWSGLTQKEKNLLIKQGHFNRRGKFLK